MFTGKRGYEITNTTKHGRGNVEITTATINKVNTAIKHHGVELVKGNGYFYFADLAGSDEYKADKIRSVYCTKLGCMTLEEWIEYVNDAIKE